MQLPIGSPGLWYYQNMAKRSTEKVIPKKPGRPATGRHPMLALRLSPALRSAIENWAKQQNDKPSRSEAIRRLIELWIGGQNERKNTDYQELTSKGHMSRLVVLQNEAICFHVPLTRTAGVELIEENGGGPGVCLRERQRKGGR